VAAGRRQDALRLAGAADALREELGSPRSATQDAELALALGGADEVADRVRVAAKAMNAHEADALVRRICADREEIDR
jgi:hypothetical protein